MRFLALICSICAFTFSYAQNNLPENFTYKKLDNGLEVLVIEDNTVPLVTIEIVVKNGAFTESPEYDGLSHLYEHMFFKANKDYPSQKEFMDKVNELGVVFNGTTSNERVNYFITLSNKKLQEGLSFMNSAIRYPLFLEEEMKNENPVVAGEFQRNESNPRFHLFRKMNEKLFGENFSRKNTIGDYDIINTATTEKMKTIQGKYYYPNNSLIAIAGDVNPTDAIKMVRDLFGDWEAADFDPFEEWPIPEFEKLKQSSDFIVEDENARAPLLYMGFHGPDIRNDVEATYAADVLSLILSQKSSKWQQILVESGLTYRAGLSYQTCRYTGPISIMVEPNPAKLKEALNEIEDQINQMTKDDFFTDEQLATAKKLLAIDDAYGREKTSEYVHTVTYWWASADIEYYTTYIDKVNEVTREDIQRYINTYIKGKPRITGLLISPQMKAELGIGEFKNLR